MAYGYFPSPFPFQIIKFYGGSLLVGNIIDVLHIGCKLFFIFINNIFTRVSDLMYHAYLCGGLREYTSYGIGKPVQVVRTGDEDILSESNNTLLQRHLFLKNYDNPLGIGSSYKVLPYHSRIIIYRWRNMSILSI